MPTAAKLVAAVMFALVGFLSAEAFKPQMPPGTQFGYFVPIVAAIGLAVGWRVMGRLAGQGYGAAAGFGLRTSITIVFWALLVFSIYRMVQLALSAMPYAGPMEAVVGIFDEAMKYGRLLWARDLLITLAAGGIVGGMATEWASRRWK